MNKHYISNRSQRAFIIRTIPWKESSILFTAFLEYSGLTKIVAKGVIKPNSPMKGILQPFTLLMIQCIGNGDIKILCKAELLSLTLPLSGKRLYYGLYINELLSITLKHELSFYELFVDYMTCIKKLLSTNIAVEQIIKYFEFSLLERLGYGINFLKCARTNIPIKKYLYYKFFSEYGFVKTHTISGYNVFSGYHIYEIHKKNFNNKDIIISAERLIKLALYPYLDGKFLKTKELFNKNLIN